jgi:Family of unknown function (DUF6345)
VKPSQSRTIRADSTTYACDTFQTSDGHFWDRWGPAYSGGLKIGVGAHDLVYDGNSQKGWEFAARMQNGEPIGQSWLEAVWYADNNNHPSVANTGVDSNDCSYRMGMDLESVQWMAPLRDFASCSTWSRNVGLRKPGVFRSTLRPSSSESSRSIPASRTSPTDCPGSNSTSTSTSLPARKSPRRTEPKKDNLRDTVTAAEVGDFFRRDRDLGLTLHTFFSRHLHGATASYSTRLRLASR